VYTLGGIICWLALQRLLCPVCGDYIELCLELPSEKNLWFSVAIIDMNDVVFAVSFSRFSKLNSNHFSKYFVQKIWKKINHGKSW
jgi:hypothetical protein